MAKTRINFESDNVRAMDAYQKGNFKLYKGFDGKYSIKIDDESFRKDIEFSEVVREFEDVYWDNFIFDYLRSVIGLNDWDIGKLMSFEEVCVEVKSESDDSCDSCDENVWYYLDCFKLFKKTGNDEYIEIVDFENIG